jgi:hypothetical protein
VVDIDDALALNIVDHASQGCFALFDRAPPQVVAVQMQQIKGKVRQLVGAGGDGVVQRIDMRDSAIVGHGDLAIQHHGPAAGGKLAEGRAEQARVIEPWRLSSFTEPSPAMIAISRQPSCFDTCSREQTPYTRPIPAHAPPA